MQIAMLAADFTRRRGRSAAPRDGGVEAARRPRAVPRAAGRPDGREGLHARIRRAHLQADPGLRRIRLPGEPRRQLRAARLRQQLDQVPPPRRVPVRPAQRQPMGFYAPAQLVRDAREHGVEVRPVDVAVSDWESTLEGEAVAPPSGAGALGQGVAPAGAARPQSRQGSRRRRGATHRRRARRCALRRRRRPRAPRAPRRACACRARRRRCAAEPHRPPSSGGVGGRRHRHAADRDAARDARRRGRGRARRAERRRGDARRLPRARPDAEPPSARAAARSLADFRVEPAARLRTFPNGRLARASGLVTHRQRPETAKGTVFVTLEDETGAVNVIVWPKIAETQRKPLLARVPAHRLRPVATRGRGRAGGDAPRRLEADRSHGAAERAGQPQP